MDSLICSNWTWWEGRMLDSLFLVGGKQILLLEHSLSSTIRLQGTCRAITLALCLQLLLSRMQATAFVSPRGILIWCTFSCYCSRWWPSFIKTVLPKWFKRCQISTPSGSSWQIYCIFKGPLCEHFSDKLALRWHTPSSSTNQLIFGLAWLPIALSLWPPGGPTASLYHLCSISLKLHVFPHAEFLSSVSIKSLNGSVQILFFSRWYFNSNFQLAGFAIHVGKADYWRSSPLMLSFK